MNSTINLHLCEVFNNEIYKRLEKIVRNRARARSNAIGVVLGTLFHDAIRSGKIRGNENIIFEKLIALSKETQAGSEALRATENMQEVPFEEFLDALVAIFDAAKCEVTEKKKKGTDTTQDERILLQFHENIDTLIHFSKSALNGVDEEHRRRKIIKYSEKETAFEHILKKFRETVSSYQKEYREIEKTAAREKLQALCTEFDGHPVYKELLEHVMGISFDKDTFSNPDTVAHFFKTHKRKIVSGLHRFYSKLDSLEGSQTWKGFFKSLFGIPETEFHEIYTGSLARGVYAKLSNGLRLAMTNFEKNMTRDVSEALTNLLALARWLYEAEFLNSLYTKRGNDESEEKYAMRLARSKNALLRMKMVEFLRKIAFFAADKDKKTDALDRTLVYLASRLGLHPENNAFVPDIFESAKKEDLQKAWNEIRKELKNYRWLEQCDYFLNNEEQKALSKPVPDLVMEIEEDIKQL
jgi:hypothetical protein